MIGSRRGTGECASATGLGELLCVQPQSACQAHMMLCDIKSTCYSLCHMKWSRVQWCRTGGSPTSSQEGSCQDSGPIVTCGTVLSKGEACLCLCLLFCNMEEIILCLILSVAEKTKRDGVVYLSCQESHPSGTFCLQLKNSATRRRSYLTSLIRLCNS